MKVPYIFYIVIMFSMFISGQSRAQTIDCDEDFLRANAVFVYAASFCKKNYRDSRAGYYALNKARACSHLEKSKLESVTISAMKEFDNIRNTEGLQPACDFVDARQKSILNSIGSTADGMTIWFFEGRCSESFSKLGSPKDDLGKKVGEPISCEKAVLADLPNGRVMMQFVTQHGVLGFAGAGINKDIHPKMAILIVDKILPAADFGSDINEIIRRSATREGVLNGAEGFCFIPEKDIIGSMSVSCTGKWEQGDKKVVYKITMDVTKPIKKTVLKFKD